MNGWAKFKTLAEAYLILGKSFFKEDGTINANKDYSWNNKNTSKTNNYSTIIIHSGSTCIYCNEENFNEKIDPKDPNSKTYGEVYALGMPIEGTIVGVVKDVIFGVDDIGPESKKCPTVNKDEISSSMLIEFGVNRLYTTQEVIAQGFNI